MNYKRRKRFTSNRRQGAVSKQTDSSHEGSFADKSCANNFSDLERYQSSVLATMILLFPTWEPAQAAAVHWRGSKPGASLWISTAWSRLYILPLRSPALDVAAPHLAPLLPHGRYLVSRDSFECQVGKEISLMLLDVLQRFLIVRKLPLTVEPGATWCLTPDSRLLREGPLVGGILSDVTLTGIKPLSGVCHALVDPISEISEACAKWQARQCQAFLTHWWHWTNSYSPWLSDLTTMDEEHCQDHHLGHHHRHHDHHDECCLSQI